MRPDQGAENAAVDILSRRFEGLNSPFTSVDAYRQTVVFAYGGPLYDMAKSLLEEVATKLGEESGRRRLEELKRKAQEEGGPAS